MTITELKLLLESKGITVKKLSACKLLGTKGGKSLCITAKRYEISTIEGTYYGKGLGTYLKMFGITLKLDIPEKATDKDRIRNIYNRDLYK